MGNRFPPAPLLFFSPSHKGSMHNLLITPLSQSQSKQNKMGRTPELHIQLHILGLNIVHMAQVESDISMASYCYSKHLTSNSVCLLCQSVWQVYNITRNLGKTETTATPAVMNSLKLKERF